MRSVPPELEHVLEPDIDGVSLVCQASPGTLRTLVAVALIGLGALILLFSAVAAACMLLGVIEANPAFSLCGVVALPPVLLATLWSRATQRDRLHLSANSLALKSYAPLRPVNSRTIPYNAIHSVSCTAKTILLQTQDETLKLYPTQLTPSQVQALTQLLQDRVAQPVGEATDVPGALRALQNGERANKTKV